MPRLALVLLALSVLCLPRSAWAHGMRTAYVEVIEIGSGHAAVHVRLGAPDPSVAPRASPDCTLVPAGDGGSIYDRTFLLDCPGGLEGHWLELSGLGPIVDDAVAWMSFADGTTASVILRPDAPRCALRRAGGAAVVREYLRLGVAHILTGYDHLLFLVLLALLLRDVKSVLWAETAFTLSHSVSFSLTALGWVRVSSAAAEACIALSLVLLAADVDARDRPPPRWRGALLALVFGLVHGLGFAGGLREIGLPEQSIGAALVSFGAGVEAGQVAFLAVVLTLLHLARRVPALPAIKLAVVYAAGGLASYWFLARGWACVAHLV